MQPLYIGADLVDMVGANSLLGTDLFLSHSYHPSHIRIEGEWLVWSAADAEEEPKEIEVRLGETSVSPKGMLDAFIRIREGNSQSVLRFAKKYGVLELCEQHGIPYTHNQPHFFLRDWEKPFEETGCVPLGWGANGNREPLYLWHHYAQVVRSLLHIALALHQGKRGALEDWLTVFGHPTKDMPAENMARALSGESFEEPLPSYLENTVPPGRINVSRAISTMLSWANVMPVLMWGETVPQPVIRMQPGSTGVFGVLAVQLMVAVAKMHSWATCEGCGVPYFREGKGKFCADCGQGAAARLRQRRHQQRVRQARELLSQGIAVKEIANRLNTTSARVDRWIQEPLRRRQSGQVIAHGA